MMLGTPNPGKSGVQVEDGVVARLLNEGRFAEAWRLLEGERSEKVSVMLNQALCHICAGEYDRALDRLDAAYSLQSRCVPAGMASMGGTAVSLAAAQNKGDAYRRGYTDEYVGLFPDVTLDSIARLRIDCLAALGKWSVVLQMASALASKGYSNVEQALAAAKEALSK